MGFPRYEKYKDSGVEWLGEVPEHWGVKKIKFLLQKNGLVRGPFGGDLKKDIFVPEGIKVYEQKNAIYKDYLLGDSYISETKFDEMSRFLVCAGDYIMSCSGTIGKAFRIPKGAPIGIINQALLIIRFNEVVTSDYADWIFSADFFQLQILDNSQGGAMKNLVGMDVFTSIGLPVPPTDEQKSISELLDRETAKIDDLIAEQQKLIELLKEKRQAVISHAVTKGLNPDAKMKDSGIEWLGEVPEHWNVTLLKHIVSTPITDGPHETPVFLDEGVPFVSAEAISSGKIDFEKIRGFISEDDYSKYSLKYYPQLYDIFMIKSGATTGVTAIVEVDTKFNIWSPLAVIRCNQKEAHPYYVLNFMRSKNFQEAVTVNWSYGTQQNIGMGVIENLAVLQPPINEQITISTFIDSQTTKLDTLISEAQKAITLLQERRTALISAAVTGKIDVRGFVPDSESVVAA